VSAIDQNPPGDEPEFDLITFDRITANMGFDTDAKRQKAMEMSNGVISRIRNGLSQPGPKFLDRLETRLGIPRAAVTLRRARQDA
jgi:hypothetical protein